MASLPCSARRACVYSRSTSALASARIGVWQRCATCNPAGLNGESPVISRICAPRGNRTPNPLIKSHPASYGVPNPRTPKEAATAAQRTRA